MAVVRIASVPCPICVVVSLLLLLVFLQAETNKNNNTTLSVNNFRISLIFRIFCVIYNIYYVIIHEISFMLRNCPRGTYGSYFVCLVLWFLLCKELSLGVGNLAACKHTGEKKMERGMLTSNIYSHNSKLII